MSLLTIILLSIFCAATFGIFAGARFVAEFLHAYRMYFVERIGPDLKQSFIVADLTLLFVGTLFFVGLLAAIGMITAGIPGAVFGIIAGLLTPHGMLKWFKRRRINQFVYQLPDALQALSSTMRAGISLPKALEQLAAWQPAPLSQEFRLVLSEYQIGRDLSEALANMQVRIPRPELELMNGAINISRSVGGNLADTLESLALTLNETLAIEGKINALTAMGRMQGWVVSFVPVLIAVALYLMNPDSIRPLFTELHGWITLAIIMVMMTLAVIMIRKIVNIDV